MPNPSCCRYRHDHRYDCRSTCSYHLISRSRCDAGTITYSVACYPYRWCFGYYHDNRCRRHHHSLIDSMAATVSRCPDFACRPDASFSGTSDFPRIKLVPRTQMYRTIYRGTTALPVPRFCSAPLHQLFWVGQAFSPRIKLGPRDILVGPCS